MNLVWTTDTHLNFLSLEKIQAFCRSIKECNPDVVVLTGDISESPLLFHHLLVLEKELEPAPVFFVCGNHDYYHSSIKEIRETLISRCSFPEKGNLCKGAYWLGSSGVVSLTNSIALVGHDGWYDGGYANYFKSRLDMNDYYLIQELTHVASPTPELRFNSIKELAKESAEYIRTQLLEAFKQGFTTVYVATHVPPFRENAIHKGKQSDDDWMPHFSSKIMGDMLLEVAENNPDKNITVLCGHSHGSAFHKPLPNLQSHTGEAQYKFPKVNKTFIL